MISGRVATIVLLCTAIAQARDLKDMPRFDRYEKLRKEIQTSVRSGAITPKWEEDSKSFTYELDGKVWRYDVGTRKASVESNAPKKGPENKGDRKKPDRGRQFDLAISSDGKWRSVYRDRNVFVVSADGKQEVRVTSEGSELRRVKCGTASWVYGEELLVKEAMWWSPCSPKLAYYRFDESQVKDFYLALAQKEVQDQLDVEAYPKAGAPNPKVDLFVYDLESKQTVRIDTGFGDPTLAEYVYDVNWSQNGQLILFNRTNRKQNVMEFCAADPTTGAARMIAREAQPNSWAENHPFIRFLKDGNRFIWSTEKDGYRNLTVRDLDGHELAVISSGAPDVASLVDVDEDRGCVYYLSGGQHNPYLLQLVRASLDGKKREILTNPALTHQVFMAPDHEHFVDVAQSSTQAPTSQLFDANGHLIDTIASSDLTKYEKLRLRPVEVFTFRAADGVTDLYGTLQFPSDFDPKKRYPLVVSVYAGPESGGANPGFVTPDAITEMGFLVASFAGRGTMGRGKAFRDAVYGKLGIVEIDDQAAGVMALAKRPYVDVKHVGIFGTSYGGYASLMAILRHPDTFAAASCSSSVTDWLNYDSIYTERYQGLPWDGENKSGYDNGRASKYASNLRGRLMLYFGTADNNVHPSNTMQVADALEKAGKRFDMMVGADKGHTGIDPVRMWEFFVQNLILQPRQDALAEALKRKKKASPSRE